MESGDVNCWTLCLQGLVKDLRECKGIRYQAFVQHVQFRELASLLVPVPLAAAFLLWLPTLVKIPLDTTPALQDAMQSCSLLSESAAQVCIIRLSSGV